MNPLRDVIAKFTVLVDDSAVQQLDKKIVNLKDNYGALAFGATAALGIAAAASYKFIQAASGVTETQNKIEALFGKAGRAQIIAWSKTVEAEMGRSEFAFQETFSDFAAFLDPLGLGTEKVVAMSQALSKLSVDLASFYNTSEEDAKMRLFSGMAGETEAVRRLGIDISDTALTALYNSDQNPLDPQHRKGKGGHGTNRGKGIAAMTLQDKALLRHKKIMMDTQKAQGDAARTATGWANTLKRLTDRQNRLNIAIGKLLEGPGTGFLNLLEGIVSTAEKVVRKSKFLELAVANLAGVAIAYTLRWAAANTALLASMLPLLKVAGLIAGVFLIIEDFWTFFSDVNAESGLGKLLTALTGVKTPLVALRDLFADINSKVQGTYNWIRKWVPIIGQMLRLTESMSGGRSYFDDTESHVNNGDDNKNERIKARNAALSKGDMQSWVDNREADMSYEEAQEEFRRRRGTGVVMGLYKPMEEDYTNSYSAPYLTESKKGGGSMVTGPVTVAPTQHFHLPAGVSVGEIEMVVKKANQEMLQTAAAKLKRGGR